MCRKILITAVFAAMAGAASAVTSEATAEFALDNVLASKRVSSGDSVTVVRDSSWAEGGVTFAMTGTEDEVLTEGARTSLVIPDVAHFKVVVLRLMAGTDEYSYSFLVTSGEPNVQAESTAEFALDSRTGTVRKAGAREQIAYSDRWSTNAEGPTVTLTNPKGEGQTLDCSGEGLYDWNVGSPYVKPRLSPGVYTFTHNDGVETQTAVFRVSSQGMCLLVR